MPGSADTEVLEPGAEEWRVQAWREQQMLHACDGDRDVALALLVAGVDYHLIEKARLAGLPVARLVEFFG